MFLYRSHLGGYYRAMTDTDDTYCETCGDSDWFIGEYHSFIELLRLYREDCELLYGRDYDESGDKEVNDLYKDDMQTILNNAVGDDW